MSNEPAPNGNDGPRGRLLDGAINWLAGRGLGDVSLRELAGALGSSHRMLIYHFGSKEGLLVAVVQETERRQQEAFAGLLDGWDGSRVDLERRFWRRIRSAELAPLERLFFEVYGQALQGRPYAVPVLDGAVDSWVELALPVLIADGLSVRDARAAARLSLAVVRGLLLDVLATGDDAGVDAAFERYLAASIALQASPVASPVTSP